MAILRSPDDTCPGQRRVPELGDVVDNDHVRVEVDDSVNAPVENVSEVVPSVVQRILESLSDRSRYQVDHRVFPENVYFEAQRREGRPDELTQHARARRVELGGDEVEEDVLGTRRVAENGVDCGE